MRDELRRLQLTQLEMLKVIDAVCKEKQIPYSLYAGTLLGAVRHQGFIPWDDDLDVCMSRADYNRFLEAWEACKPEGYILQNKENAPDFTQSFSKIRKLNTTYCMEADLNKQYHQGVFVDIFPLDRIPEGMLARKMFRLRCMLYQLYTREFVPEKSNSAVRFGSRLLLTITPRYLRGNIRKRLLAKITQYSDDKTLPVIAIETVNTLRTLYPSDMLDRYVRLPFEDGEYQCFANWEENLRLKFGNYMQMPPEEERTWRHPPVCMDFEKEID